MKTVTWSHETTCMVKNLIALPHSSKAACKTVVRPEQLLTRIGFSEKVAEFS
jgi:hypothetical protein